MALAKTRAHGATVGTHPTVHHAVETRLLEERTRWAMQIHDGLTQSVTSAVLELQTMRHRIETDPKGAVAALREVEDEIRDDLRRIRELLFELTNTDLAHAEPTIAAVVRDAMSRWHVPTTLDVSGDVETIADDVLEAVCAIIAESLANVAKHAGASQAHVRVWVDDEVRVEIRDHGSGIAEITDDAPHFGLQIMQARTDALGGSLNVGSVPGAGTTVVAVLPVGGRGEVR